MTPEQFCAQAALGNAAQWVSLGIEMPPADVVGVAVIEYCGMRVTVTIERDKPPVAPVAVVAVPVVVLPDLREIERLTLEAMPDRATVTVKKLSILAGYAYTSYFRSAVQRLVDLHLLTRDSHGVKRSH